MQTLPIRARTFAVALSFVAGFVDALGFVYSGGYFVSFMSGNTTNFAVRGANLVGGVGIAASLIALFVAGVVSASLIARTLPSTRRHVLVDLIAFLLAVAAVAAALGPTLLTLALMPVAMGAMNTIFERNGEAPFGVTYMTGALVKFGQSLATAISGGPKWNWTPHLMLWLGLVTGAFCGALAFPYAGLQGLWLPVIALLALGRVRLYDLNRPGTLSTST
jgi:uncharacterized membrane protein YoaK (UPF0700 family)